MKNKNFPTWLVPLEIAKELKEIGFDLPCAYFYNNKYEKSNLCINTIDDDIHLGGVDYKNTTFIKAYEIHQLNNNERDLYFSVPTWEQVFEWFREKGFESYISIDNHSYIDEGSYYFYAITNEIGGEIDVKGDFDDYNVAREALVKALIQTYKREQYKINSI